MEDAEEFENNDSLLYAFCPCEVWNGENDKKVLAYYGYEVQEERYFYLDNDFENSEAVKYNNFSIVGFCDLNLAKTNKKFIELNRRMQWLEKEKIRLSYIEYPDTMGQ